MLTKDSHRDLEAFMSSNFPGNSIMTLEVLVVSLATNFISNNS